MCPAVTRRIIPLPTPTESSPPSCAMCWSLIPHDLESLCVGDRHDAAMLFATVRFSAPAIPQQLTHYCLRRLWIDRRLRSLSSTHIFAGLLTPQTTTFDVPLSPGFTFHWRVVATNGMKSIPGSAFSPDQLFAVPAAFPLFWRRQRRWHRRSIRTRRCLENYLPTSPWLLMTNVAGLGESGT